VADFLDRAQAGGWDGRILGYGFWIFRIIRNFHAVAVGCRIMYGRIISETMQRNVAAEGAFKIPYCSFKIRWSWREISNRFHSVECVREENFA
jgi:hypothetical protein